MSNFKKFSSIEQFRNVIRDVAFDYKNEETLPTLTFLGTIKLHGTNCAIGYNFETNQLFTQKRNSICTIENDNYGFAAWVEENRDEWIKNFTKNQDVNKNRKFIYFYGEWCGGNIQKDVALSQLPKMFVRFQTVEVFNNSEKLTKALNREVSLPIIKNVYDINDFETFEIEIDFNNPKLVQNKLIEITETVENECPVGRHFGVSGVGEGVVWSNENYRFKVKGSAHSVSKVKKLVEVDIEKLKNIDEFLDRCVTENRLNQALDELRSENIELEMKNIGKFLSWMFHDIVKEENDVIEASGLEKREYSKGIAIRAKRWFINKMREET